MSIPLLLCLGSILILLSQQRQNSLALMETRSQRGISSHGN